MTRFSLAPRLLALLVGVAIFLLFSPALALPFLGDDVVVLNDLYKIQQEQRLLQQVISDFSSTWLNGSAGFFYRPLVVVTYALDMALWGSNAWGWHATNLLLHSANSVLMFAVVWQLVKREQPRWGLGIALGAALFFGMRPLVGEVVFWISGRGDSLAVLGMLAGLYAFLKSEGVWRSRWMIGAVLGFAVALGSKEVAMTFPAAIGAWYIARWLAAEPRGTWRSHLRQAITGILPFVALLALYLLARRVMFGSFFTVYPTTLPMDFADEFWRRAKLETFLYLIDLRLPPSYWVLLQNATLAALVGGGLLLGLRYRLSRLLWWLGAIWGMGLFVAAFPQIYVTGFGEGERLLYSFIPPFTLMVISPLGALPPTLRAPLLRHLTWASAGLLLLVFIITTPWTMAQLQKWLIVGENMNQALVAIRTEAASVPADQTRILILPASIQGVHLARNAQGGMMAPPLQDKIYYGAVLVRAAERPCEPGEGGTPHPIYDYRCWDVPQRRFLPFDPATYQPNDALYYWALQP